MAADGDVTCTFVVDSADQALFIEQRMAIPEADELISYEGKNYKVRTFLSRNRHLADQPMSHKRSYSHLSASSSPDRQIPLRANVCMICVSLSGFG